MLRPAFDVRIELSDKVPLDVLCKKIPDNVQLVRVELVMFTCVVLCI